LSDVNCEVIDYMLTSMNMDVLP